MPAHKLQVLIDADVLFAGAASPSTHGASYIVLQLAELTLIECLTSEQVIAEADLDDKSVTVLRVLDKEQSLQYLKEVSDDNYRTGKPE